MNAIYCHIPSLQNRIYSVSTYAIKKGGLSSPFVFQLFHVELITADRFVIYAWVAELVDARDLKSLGHYGCTSSILVPGTIKIKGLRFGVSPLFFFRYPDVAALYKDCIRMVVHNSYSQPNVYCEVPRGCVIAVIKLCKVLHNFMTFFCRFHSFSSCKSL